MSDTVMDEIIDDIVVFIHPTDGPFSMDHRWQDSRVREAWQAKQDGKSSTESDPEDDDPVDYTGWTNDELRAELARRELSVDGKKLDLIKRLEEDDYAQDEEDS